MNVEMDASAPRVLVVPNEMPLPANSGGRIDVWRRLQLLRNLSTEVALLSWYDMPRNGDPTLAQRDELGRVCRSVYLVPVRRNLREMMGRISLMGRLPSHAASRWVSLDLPVVLDWARSFRPTVLLLDGLYGVAVVRWLSNELGVPWVYRSHNIEHQYMRMQLTQATRWSSRLGLFANLIGLKRLEERTVQDARTVLDISPDDAAFWKAHCPARVQWLPPLVDDAFSFAIAEASTRPANCDALYFGNLNTPNNVEAVRWLVTKVLPLVRYTGMRLLLAGSRPSDEVQALIASDPRIQLNADPANMASVVGRARILLNPVQGGSGVNLKSVEMLFSNAWLLSTPAGVQGLPPKVAACFELQATPEGFASALDRLACNDEMPAPNLLTARAEARTLFTRDRAAPVLSRALALAGFPASFEAEI